MGVTKIEYITHSWNPLAMRCSPVSPGCAHCWHLAMAKRQAANPILSADRRAAAAGGPPVLLEKELAMPLRLRQPARIGVQFMGDLFHEDVPNEHIDRVFGIIAGCPTHTFLILTKRAERMADYVGDDPIRRSWLIGQAADKDVPGGLQTSNGYFGPTSEWRWPLPNVWLGVTVENADYLGRIDRLKGCPAAKLFVSIEPMLGPLPTLGEYLDGIDWVIAGGESGPHARPSHPDWFRRVRDQCQAAGKPFFLKQICERGRKIPFEQWPQDLQIRETPDAH